MQAPSCLHWGSRKIRLFSIFWRVNLHRRINSRTLPGVFIDHVRRLAGSLMRRSSFAEQFHEQLPKPSIFLVHLFARMPTDADGETWNLFRVRQQSDVEMGTNGHAETTWNSHNQIVLRDDERNCEEMRHTQHDAAFRTKLLQQFFGQHMPGALHSNQRMR